MVRTMSLEDMDIYVEALIRDKFESMAERHIIEEYERIGD